MFSKHLLNCGGPPQADRSSWREQKDHSNPIRVPVEVAFQSIQRTAVQVAERRLAGGHLMPAEVEARRNQQNDCRSSEHGHSSQTHCRFLLWKQVRKDACQGLRKNECGQNHDRGKPKYRDARSAATLASASVSIQLRESNAEQRD